MAGPGRHAVDSPEAARRLLAEVAGLFTTPALHCAGVDLEAGTLSFVAADRGRFAEAPAHSVPVLRASTPEALSLSVAGLLHRFQAARPEGDPVRYLLHPAFSASTLLSRALEAATPTFALREPDVLQQLLWARARARGDPGRTAGLEPVWTLVLHLLARHFPDQVATVVKASDAPTMALGDLLAAQPESPFLFVWAAPEAFVASAIKSEERRAWLSERARWFERGALPWPARAAPITEDTAPARIAVALWLAHTGAIREAAARIGDGRLRTLATAAFLADPVAVTEAAARFFGLPLHPALPERLAPVLGAHAKYGGGFGPGARRAELAALATRHADEIADALAFGAAAFGAEALEAPLPAPLLVVPASAPPAR